MTDEQLPVFIFDDFQVEPATFQILKAGVQVQLEPKTLKLLLFFIENRGRLIEKGELLDAVWKDTAVTENALVQEIAKLRRTLGDDPKQSRYIKTVHTRGYQFVANVEVGNGHRANGSFSKEQAAAARREMTSPDTTSAAIEVPVVVPQEAEAKLAPRRSLARKLLPFAGVFCALVLAAIFVWKANWKPATSSVTGAQSITRLTTGSGLDVNPTFSPDGNVIAYSSGHSGSFEVYARQLTPGGREIQLTFDGAQNFDPSWSPDGQHIAYYSMKRGGIWVIPALGGKATQLTEFGSHPVWSRDGSMIAFQSVASPDLGASPLGSSTIFIVPSQGGAPQQITQTGNPQGSHVLPSWSPDGKRIAFLQAGFSSQEIWSIAVAGDALKQITQPGNGDKADPLYAPDGEGIYYTQGFLLWQQKISPPSGEPLNEPPIKIADMGTVPIRQLAISADGKKLSCSAWIVDSNLWSITLSPDLNTITGEPIPLTNEIGVRNSTPAFSPDGRMIAYMAERRGVSADVWLMDADGKNQRQLTSDPAADYFPTWYPGGKEIAFVSEREGRLRLWAIRIDSGKESPLFEFGEKEMAQLSPDGEQVAFCFNQNGVFNIGTMPLAGGPQKQLSFDIEMAGWPCWSPDGQSLAFQARRGDDTQIMVVPAGGGTPIQLTSNRGHSWSNSWAPDGDKIALAGSREGIWNVWWVSRSDKKQRQLTHNTKPNAYVRFPTWSPSGNQIVYEYTEVKGNIYVISLK
jgi:Tol biopolymer transport system component/DNA-binding winged helix-turn-helix (wHTH) protein